jgi:hypothetical protein
MVEALGGLRYSEVAGPVKSIFAIVGCALFLVLVDEVLGVHLSGWRGVTHNSVAMACGVVIYLSGRGKPRP